MNQKALYNEKVNQQLGREKAAVKDYGKWLQVTKMGYKEDMLDLKIEIA